MEIQNYNHKNILRVLLFVLLSLAFLKRHQNSKKLSIDAEWNQEVLRDSLYQYKTREGLSAAKIKVFESNKASDFIKLATKDSVILKLQKLVKDNQKYISKQGSVATVSTETNIDATVATIIENDPLIPEKDKYPIYKSNFNLKGWIWGSSVATRDSTSYKINYKEELTLVIGREKHGFLGLGKSTPFADVKLLNPYSSVKDMRVYQTQLPSIKRFGVGPTISYGIGNDFKAQVFIGFGVNWNLIQF